MRFFEVSAGAIAAAALLQGAVASPAQQPQGYGDSSAPATGPTTSVTTYYTTMTVFRVETTVTATRNGSTTAYETASTATSTALASATIPSYGNGTSFHGGAQPTGITPSPGAASGLQVCSMAVAAVAGVAGLLLL